VFSPSNQAKKWSCPGGDRNASSASFPFSGLTFRGHFEKCSWFGFTMASPLKCFCFMSFKETERRGLCVTFLTPISDTNGTNVFKSGPLTKTTIYSVFRGRLRRRNQTKRNLPLAFQFVCGPPSPRAANKLEGKWKVRTTKNHENRHLCR